MQVIILASGLGSRLKELTVNKPKCLISLNGKALLDHQLEVLKKQSVREYIFTTGYLADKLVTHVNDKHSALNSRFVHNEIFDSTNYIYSLWKCRKYVKNDVLLLHSDLIITDKIIKDLFHSAVSAVPVHDTMRSDKDFNSEIIDGRVRKVAVGLTGEKVGFTLPCYKFLLKDWNTLMNQIDRHIQDGKHNDYAEEALNILLEKELHLYPILHTDNSLMEIDDFEDLKIASNLTK